MSETDLPEDFGTITIDGKKYVSGQCLDCAARDQQIAAQAELIARLQKVVEAAKEIDRQCQMNLTPALGDAAILHNALYELKILQGAEGEAKEILNSTPESLEAAEVGQRVIEAAEKCDRTGTDLAIRRLQALEMGRKLCERCGGQGKWRHDCGYEYEEVICTTCGGIGTLALQSAERNAK